MRKDQARTEGKEVRRVYVEKGDMRSKKLARKVGMAEGRTGPLIPCGGGSKQSCGRSRGGWPRLAVELSRTCTS